MTAEEFAVACAVLGDVVSDTCDGWRGTSCVLINAPAAPCDCGVVVGGAARISEGDAPAVGEGGVTAASEGGGESTAAGAGAATAGGGVGAGAVCSCAGGTALVSCVRNSEEIGSIGVRGGID